MESAIRKVAKSRYTFSLIEEDSLPNALAIINSSLNLYLEKKQWDYLSTLPPNKAIVAGGFENGELVSTLILYLRHTLIDGIFPSTVAVFGQLGSVSKGSIRKQGAAMELTLWTEHYFPTNHNCLFAIGFVGPKMFQNFHRKMIGCSRVTNNIEEYVFINILSCAQTLCETMHSVDMFYSRQVYLQLRDAVGNKVTVDLSTGQILETVNKTDVPLYILSGVFWPLIRFICSNNSKKALKQALLKRLFSVKGILRNPVELFFVGKFLYALHKKSLLASKKQDIEIKP